MKYIRGLSQSDSMVIAEPGACREQGMQEFIAIAMEFQSRLANQRA